MGRASFLPLTHTNTFSPTHTLNTYISSSCQSHVFPQITEFPPTNSLEKKAGFAGRQLRASIDRHSQASSVAVCVAVWLCLCGSVCVCASALLSQRATATYKTSGLLLQSSSFSHAPPLKCVLLFFSFRFFFLSLSLASAHLFFFF